MLALGLHPHLHANLQLGVPEDDPDCYQAVPSRVVKVELCGWFLLFESSVFVTMAVANLPSIFSLVVFALSGYTSGYQLNCQHCGAPITTTSAIIDAKLDSEHGSFSYKHPRLHRTVQVLTNPSGQEFEVCST
jgi:hypothetical protein